MFSVLFFHCEQEFFPNDIFQLCRPVQSFPTCEPQQIAVTSVMETSAAHPQLRQTASVFCHCPKPNYEFKLFDAGMTDEGSRTLVSAHFACVSVSLRCPNSRAFEHSHVTPCSEHVNILMSRFVQKKQTSCFEIDRNYPQGEEFSRRKHPLYKS